MLTHLKRTGIVLLGAVCTAAMSVSVTAPAEAAAKRYSTKYSISQTVRSADLKTCFTVAETGTMSAVGTPYKQGFFWSKEELQAPKISISAYSCTTKKGKKLKKVQLEQSWYDVACHNSFSFGASTWGVEVSVTPSCGKEKVAYRKTVYTNVTHATQSNSGFDVTFNGRDSARWCTQPLVEFTAYIGSKSDTIQIKNTSKVCIRK